MTYAHIGVSDQLMCPMAQFDQSHREGPTPPNVDSKYSEQTGQMPRLICKAYNVGWFKWSIFSIFLKLLLFALPLLYLT